MKSTQKTATPLRALFARVRRQIVKFNPILSIPLQFNSLNTSLSSIIVIIKFFFSSLWIFRFCSSVPGFELAIVDPNLVDQMQNDCVDDRDMESSSRVPGFELAIVDPNLVDQMQNDCVDNRDMESSSSVLCFDAAIVEANLVEQDVISLDTVGADDVERWKLLRFSTVSDALNFYRNHAHRRGFTVRIGSQAQSKSSTNGSNIVRYMYYYCNKEGFKENSFNNPSYGDNVEKLLVPTKKKQRNVKEERIGCPARIHFKYIAQDSTYMISLWIDNHNHQLHPPELSHFIRSNRNISEVQGLLIEVNQRAGLSNKISYELICQASGGKDVAGFLKLDLRNFLRGKRTRDMAPGDLSILLQFLNHESQTKPSFFYDIQLDEDELITNIFWSDGVMQHDYECFGDLLSLDTTFRTNKEYFPLAPFLGFTHNRQCCIFGAALLYDQTAATFEWLLHTFLKCMRGKKPITIFTDQDLAMKKAICLVLPECFHGLCSWHICQNAATNLSAKYTQDFKTHFNYLIQQVDDEGEFDYSWKLMIDQCFGGEPHPWLNRIHSLRKQWSSAWVKSHFTAGLKTTQLSESFNSFIRDYLCISHSLPQFFQQFNVLVDDMRVKHNKSVYESVQYLPDVRFQHSPIVIQASQIYTPPIFNLFQEQYSLLPKYLIELHDSTDDSLKKVYSVFKLDPLDQKIRLDVRIVEIDLENMEWVCSCRMFLNWGILCCHILKVLDILGSSACYVDLRSLPEKYLLKRWSRNARGNIATWTLPKTTDGSNSSRYAIRYQSYCSSLIRNANRVCITDEVYCFFMKEVNELFTRVDERFKLSSILVPTTNDQPLPIVTTDAEVQYRLQSAKGIKKKENPNKSKKRLKAAREIAIDRLKAKRRKSMNPATLVTGTNSPV